MSLLKKKKETEWRETNGTSTNEKLGNGNQKLSRQGKQNVRHRLREN